MPIFIDRHDLSKVPRDARLQLMDEAACKLVDENGVQPLSHWGMDGHLYCVIRAPTEDDIRKHHSKRNVPFNDPIFPIPAADQIVIMHTISNLWGD